MEPTQDEVNQIELLLAAPTVVQDTPDAPTVKPSQETIGDLTADADAAFADEPASAPTKEAPAHTKEAPAQPTRLEEPPTLEIPKKKMKKAELIASIQQASEYICRPAPDEARLMQRKAADLRDNLEALRKAVDEKKRLVASLAKLSKAGVKPAREPETMSVDDLKRELAKHMSSGADQATRDPMALLACDPGEFLFYLNIGVTQTAELVARTAGFPYLDGWTKEVTAQHDVLKQALTEIYEENAEWLAPMMTATTRWAMVMIMSATKTIAGNYTAAKHHGSSTDRDRRTEAARGGTSGGATGGAQEAPQKQSPQ
jgi:hypothetical protein